MKRKQKGKPRVDSAADVLTSSGAAKLLQVSTETLLSLDVPWFAAGGGRKRPRRRYLRASVLEWCRRREAAA